MATETIGGCIRFTETGPKWHINSSHVTVGFDTSQDPTIDSTGRLHVVMTDTRPVVTTTAAADETLTARGIRAGGSGGVSALTIQFWKSGINGADGTPLNLNNATHYDRISDEFANVWLTVVKYAG